MTLFSEISGLWIVYGPAGVGKTTFCMHAAGEVLEQGNKVVFIDAEHSLDLQRFQEVNEDKNLDINKLLILRPKNFSDLHSKILGLRNLLDHCSLLIVDTIGSFYRREAADDLKGTSNMAEMQMRILAELSKHLPVIVTNQVGAVMGTNTVRMVGGKIIERWGSTIVELTKEPRQMKFKKPNDDVKEFVIERKGVVFT